MMRPDKTQFVDTEDGYIPLSRILRIFDFDTENNRAQVEWFDGTAVQITSATAKREMTTPGTLTLFVAGADLRLVLPKSTREKLLAEGVER